MSDSPDPASYQFGPFVLDATAAELLRDRVRLPLPPQPVRILALLLRRHGQLVTREEIREAIWGAHVHVDFDRALNFAIKQIREALDDDAERPIYIETLRARGYRFIAPVERIPDGPAAAPEFTEDTQTAPQHPAPTDRRGWIRPMSVAVAAALLGAVTLVAIFQNRREPNERSIRSLVVLPIQNLSGSSDNEYLADGMTDALIGNLAQIGRLRVISRTSAMTYKNAGKTVPTIAGELKVDAVVEGTLQQTEHEIRLSITLIDAAGDTQLWSNTYHRARQDIATLQTDVARDVAARIHVALLPLEQARLTPSRPVDPKVYEAYLKGRYFWNRRTNEDIQRAIAHFKEAIALDSSYAPAYAGLADSYGLVGTYAFAAGELSWQQAIAMADRAIALDDDLADGHVSRAAIAMNYEWNWTRADAEFRRALELNPGYATARHWYGYYLMLVRRFREAETQIAAALELDPLSPIINANVAFCRFAARNYDGALAHLQKALEMHPNDKMILSYMGVVHLAKGSYAEGISLIERSVTSNVTPQDQALLAHAHARNGNTAKARAMLADLQRRSQDEFVPSYYLALLHIGLGEKDEAFAAFDRALAERAGPLNELNIDPMVDPLRDDPRFDRLLQRMNMR